MERGKQFAALAQSEEERLILVRAWERLVRGSDRDMPVSTAFLTPREQALLRTALPQCTFFGGAEGAERAVAYYLPEYLTREDYFTDGPIACFHLSFYEKNSVGHRDLLGALMGLGLRRDAVGDISMGERDGLFFVLRELAPFLKENLTSAGRHHLSLTEIPLAKAVLPSKEEKTVRLTVSSLRLDSLLAGIFHMSRGTALDAIRAGKAAINGLPCEKPDKTVAVEDVLSLRGSGKARVIACNGETRKGRLAITAGIYI